MSVGLSDWLETVGSLLRFHKYRSLLASIKISISLFFFTSTGRNNAFSQRINIFLKAITRISNSYDNAGFFSCYFLSYTLTYHILFIIHLSFTCWKFSNMATISMTTFLLTSHHITLQQVVIITGQVEIIIWHIQVNVDLSCRRYYNT